MSCRTVNVSDATLTIRTELRGQFLTNGQEFSVPSDDVELAAGRIRDEFVTIGTRLNAYCTFTVVNGTADDIRATLVVLNQGSEKISLAAE